MNYETENCIYSLVRFNADGTMESVGLKDGFKNLNNLPLLYSFKDIKIPDTNTEYVLYRIGSDAIIIGKFSFNATTKSLKVLDISQHISENTKN